MRRRKGRGDGWRSLGSECNPGESEGEGGKGRMGCGDGMMVMVM